MTENEFAVIARYFRNLSTGSVQVVTGPGDDCAVIQVAPGHELCVSTDTLIEGVHFPVSAPASTVAARVFAASASDLAAMGAVPHGFVLALTMPAVDEAWLTAFADTLAELADRYEMPLTGGNLSKGALSLTMTVMGQVPDGQAILRSGARTGDGVFVTGTLGDAGQGLVRVTQGDYSGYLAERYTHPTPRIDVGLQLRGIATAMIDISDGLAADAAHIAAESGVRLNIELGEIPLSPELMAETGREQALRLAASAGDDYELCFTAPPEAAPDLERIALDTGVAITRIGVVDQGEGVSIVDASGRPVPASGYRHFQ